jgi:hypothetical protein
MSEKSQNAKAGNPKSLGRQAYECNKTIQENPFDRNAERVDHFGWREGWLIAQAEDKPIKI